MKTELELEAENYARRFEEKEQSGYNGESLSIEDRIEIEAFIAIATSNYSKNIAIEFGRWIVSNPKISNISSMTKETAENYFNEFLKTIE